MAYLKKSNDWIGTVDQDHLHHFVKLFTNIIGRVQLRGPRVSTHTVDCNTSEIENATENTQLLCKGKYHCTADLLLGFSCFVELKL